MSDVEGDKKVVEMGELRDGSYCIIEGEAYVVVDIKKSAPGKHGHAKYRITCTALVGSKKRVIMASGHDHIDVPVILKRDAQILSIKDKEFDENGKMTGMKIDAMDTNTFETFELVVPEEYIDKVNEGAIALYWEILGKKVFKGIRSKS